MSPETVHEGEVDIDPNSPERGQFIPVTMSFQKEASNWYRATLLSIQPVWGFPLRPRTTYALVLTKDFVEADQRFPNPESTPGEGASHSGTLPAREPGLLLSEA